MDMGIDVMAALAAFAMFAGIIDAIAGGGGLLIVPALLLAGLDPAQAIASNKVQGTFAVGSSAYHYGRQGLIDWRKAWPFAVTAFIGSMLGALCISFLPRAVLETATPVLLIVIALYFALSPKLTNADARARMSALAFGLTAPVAIGFYDGIFGPGAGSFYMVAFTTLLGYGIMKATAHTKVVNLASNLGSLAVYAVAGVVVWPVGLVMAAGALVGAQIGSRLAVRFGARLIRPLLVIMSTLMALRLLLDPANPWREGLAGLF
jgi:uncharacterized membrane protein YfcA